MKDYRIEYGVVQSSNEIGKIARAHRNHLQHTLKTISALSNLSMRFLSEFERGKETAEIGKVLKALRTVGLEVVIRPVRSGIAEPTPPPPSKGYDGSFE